MEDKRGSGELLTQRLLRLFSAGSTSHFLPRVSGSNTILKIARLGEGVFG